MMHFMLQRRGFIRTLSPTFGCKIFTTTSALSSASPIVFCVRDQARRATSGRRPTQFIIYNTNFLVFNATFLVLNTKFLVFDTKFIIFYSRARCTWAILPDPSAVSKSSDSKTSSSASPAGASTAASAVRLCAALCAATAACSLRNSSF